MLPLGLGYLEDVSYDYVRYGTTTLFAVLDIATGTVSIDCKPRHRHQELVSFLKRIDAAGTGRAPDRGQQRSPKHVKCTAGSPSGHVSTFTTRRPTLPDLTKWNADLL